MLITPNRDPKLSIAKFVTTEMAACSISAEPKFRAPPPSYYASRLIYLYLSIYENMYTYICVYIYIYIYCRDICYMYIYIYRERERGMILILLFFHACYYHILYDVILSAEVPHAASELLRTAAQFPVANCNY